MFHVTYGNIDLDLGGCLKLWAHTTQHTVSSMSAKTSTGLHLTFLTASYGAIVRPHY
jgi:hypothetical protein